MGCSLRGTCCYSLQKWQQSQEVKSCDSVGQIISPWLSALNYTIHNPTSLYQFQPRALPPTFPQYCTVGQQSAMSAPLKLEKEDESTSKRKHEHEPEEEVEAARKTPPKRRQCAFSCVDQYEGTEPASLPIKHSRHLRIHASQSRRHSTSEAQEAGLCRTDREDQGQVFHQRHRKDVKRSWSRATQQIRDGSSVVSVSTYSLEGEGSSWSHCSLARG